MSGIISKGGEEEMIGNLISTFNGLPPDEQIFAVYYFSLGVLIMGAGVYVAVMWIRRSIGRMAQVIKC